MSPVGRTSRSPQAAAAVTIAVEIALSLASIVVLTGAFMLALHG
jgi:hypothetical protein